MGLISFLGSDSLTTFASEYSGIWGLVVSAGVFVIGAIIRSVVVKELENGLSDIANTKKPNVRQSTDRGGCVCVSKSQSGNAKDRKCDTGKGRKKP